MGAALADFVARLFEALGRQLVLGFGLLVVLGVVLSLLQRTTQRLLYRAIGRRGTIYFTGWLGTPVHELAHACVGFPFVKIVEVKLYQPDDRDGVLGYVRWVPPRWHWKNTHQLVGSFLMGIAPLFCGAGVILLALLLLAPGADAVLRQAQALAGDVERGAPRAVLDGFGALVKGVFQALFADGAGSWRPWLFLYITLCVGGHLAPSRADLEGSVPGLVTILLLALLANAVALACGLDPNGAAATLARLTGPLAALLLLVLVLNLAVFGVAALLAVTVGRRRR